MDDREGLLKDADYFELTGRRKLTKICSEDGVQCQKVDSRVNPAVTNVDKDR